MKIYLVGGAVRDQLLGLTPKERDWVVVGATPREMLAQGYRQVGRDFPVFLHPRTHEEYALARTERKTGKGYKGFICHADPSVTLEEDLARRDLTINAIAKTKSGQIIDPYGGQQDLAKKILRHVSAAFAEDPVRILRVARFAARFGDFKVHPQTNVLMQQMLQAGEVAALVPERVWQELVSALNETFPYRFFEVLKSCQILSKLFPEIAPRLRTIKPALKKAVMAKAKDTVRFAALFYAATPQELTAFCQRLRVPKAYYALALMVIKYHEVFNQVLHLTAREVLQLIEHIDALRRPERFMEFLQTCVLCSKNGDLEPSKLLSQCYKVVATTQVAAMIKSLSPEKIPQIIRQARLEKLEVWLKKYHGRKTKLRP